MPIIQIKLIAVMLFWGIAFISGRVLSQSHHPFVVAFIRFFIAAIVFLPLMYAQNKKFYKINFTQFLKVLFLALTGVFSYNYFFFSGLKIVEASRASIIISINPTITAILSALFLNEKLTKLKIIGAIIALSGVSIVITRGDLSLLFTNQLGLGELSLLAAVASWVAYTIFGKVSLKKITPLEASGFASIIGSMLLLPFALRHNLILSLNSLQITELIHFANLGILSTCFGFFWYYQGVQEIGAARASSYINLIPIFGASSGIIFLGEKLSLSLITGGALVILAIYLINRKEVTLIKN
jgi:drug/metabolite transporter (DMT)-like permease